MFDAKRLAHTWIRMKTAADWKSLQSETDDLINAIQGWRDRLSNHMETLDALRAAGERRRLDRIADIRVKSYKVDDPDNPQVITSVVQGTTDLYNTQLILGPRRGHRCTCPDWQKNGPTVGPCKHVLAVGEVWRKRVEIAFYKFQDALTSALSKTEI